MASEDLSTKPQEMTKEEKERLKYLEFVQAAAVHAVFCFASLYEKAKEKSGPLKLGVESVEGAVKIVVGPVYDKFHDVPVEFLKYLDCKVDESVTQVDRRVSAVLKQASSQAVSAAQKVPAVASEVHRAGIDTAKSVYTKYEPAAKELYASYEPKAEQYAAMAWRKLNQLPLFPQVAQVVVPTAAYCSEKYNSTVKMASEKGYKVSSYLPLVPTERIGKIFREENTAEAEPLASS